MSRPKHIYFLYNPETSKFYYVENDLVKQTGRPRRLDFAPGGWQDISIQNVRNTTYFGIDRSFSVPLDYYETAGKIVKQIFYQYGTEARLLQIIMEEKLFYDGVNYGFYYDEFYKGELDLSKFVHAGHKATANIMEGGFSKMLKDKEGQTFTYPASDSTMPRIYNDGVLLVQKSTYIVYNGDVLNNLGGHTLALNLINTESIDSLGSVSERRVVTSNAAGPLWATNEKFINIGVEDTDVTLTWDFKMTPQLAEGVGPVNPTTMILQLQILTSSTTTVNKSLYIVPTTDPILLYNHEHHFHGTATYNVPAGARLLLYMTANQNRDLTYYTYSSDTGTLTVDYNYRKEPTFIKGFDLFDIGGKIINSMTDGDYTFASNLLTKPGFRIAITSVDCIRLFSQAKVKITWKEFWEFCNTVWDCGLYVLGKVVHLELKEDMIDYNDYVHVGELSDVKITPATDWQFPSMKIGYPNEKYENVNGLQEFNTTQEYKTPISRGAVKEWVGSIRADCYGIEFLRITLDGKPTTDSVYDGNLFAIHLEDTFSGKLNENGVPELVYSLNRDLNPYATGLITPASVYNLKLSPKQCFYRKENYIKSCMYWQDAKKIVYSTQDKNANVVVSAPGQRVVDEDADVLVGDLNHRYFLPVQCEATVVVDDNFLQIIENTPQKTIRGTIDGIEYLFLPIKNGADPETNKEQAFTMLFWSGTDFTYLIDYFG